MRLGPLFALLLAVTMIRRTAALAFSNPDQIKVAILGSGISGCTVANTLLKSSASAGKKFDITLYEAAYGIGGRMSTRPVHGKDNNNGNDSLLYQFDHGCQSIDPPKTTEFEDEFMIWKERGWIKPWRGQFATIQCNSGSSINTEQTKGQNKQQLMDCHTREEERYVGYPSMNSICEHLVQGANSSDAQSSTIQVKTQTQARAIHVPSLPNKSTTFDSVDRVWQCEQVTKKDRDAKHSLGDFDWVIVTDRNSAQNQRVDLQEANVQSFAKSVYDEIKSVKSIAAMVAFDQPLPIPANGIEINHASNKDLMRQQFGTLGWVARDSSKPGRQESIADGVECWVLHADQDEAKRLLGQKGLKHAKLAKIRETIRETMVEDFINSIPLLISMTRGDKNNKMSQAKVQTPNVVHSMGHRWGAAFPKHISDECEYKHMDFHANDEKQFIACGDYFGEYSGSVEGAFLSGQAAAKHLIDQVSNK